MASHTTLPRHQTLRATIDWSYQLLSDSERRLLRRLAVFHGGFRREAAEQVAGATLPDLMALVDKSLVSIEERHGEARYRMLAENSHDVIWTVDFGLNLTYISPSVERLRGFTVDEVMTQRLEEITRSGQPLRISSAFDGMEILL